MERSTHFYDDFELEPIPEGQTESCKGCAFGAPGFASDECMSSPACTVDGVPMIFVRKVPQ